MLFKEGAEDSAAQIHAFEDTWHWKGETIEQFNELVSDRHYTQKVADLMQGLEKLIGHNDMMAYLTMMAARLFEIHRVLKETGSLYLHCDPTASHYLRTVLDAIFGPENFRNEIVWKRTSAHNDPNKYGANIDIVLFYTKSDSFTWNPLFISHDEKYISRFRFTDSDGRKWTDDNLTAKGLSGGGYEYEYKGCTSLWRVPVESMKKLDAENKLHFTKNGGIRLKRYLDETKGVALQCLWDDIPPINSQAKERLGYPTQKPIALLERIIQASSNEGDWILDPFGGCGTTAVAAEKLRRNWCIIDVTTLAINLVKRRIEEMYPETKVDMTVDGYPADTAGAKALFDRDPFEFEYWCCDLINARPAGDKSKGKMKGADRGIDGVITFQDATGKETEFRKILVQVKGGHVKSGDIRDFRGTIEREKAAGGVFITLEEPSKPMRQESIEAGTFTYNLNGQKYPMIQILTVKELLDHKKPEHPPAMSYAKKAERVQSDDRQAML